MARSADTVLATLPGLISKLILLSAPMDDAFKQRISIKQKDLNEVYSLDGIAGPNALIQAAKDTTHGPFSFVAITQPAVTGTARVNVLHTMKDYTLSTLMPPNVDEDLIGKVYVFAGKLSIMDDMIEFPSCYKQPDQITTALTPQTVL